MREGGREVWEGGGRKGGREVGEGGILREVYKTWNERRGRREGRV